MAAPGVYEMPVAAMLNLAIPAAVVVAGLGLALFLALYLFCTLKAEIRAAERRLRPPAPPELSGPAQARIEARPDAPASIETALGGAPAAASAVPVRPGMNLSRRSQALRLARRGESPEQIASRLGLATGEVRLLLKIHGTLMQQAIAGPERSGPLNSGLLSADNSSSAPQASARAVQRR